MILNLCQQLDVKLECKPQNLKEIDAYLRLYFQGKNNNMTAKYNFTMI